MSLSTHVLDTGLGEPAPGVPVRLERAHDGGWIALAAGVTDADGRLRDWIRDDEWHAGTYRLTFDTAARSAFFPEVSVVFFVSEPGRHHHVPLLLSPYGYTTYRGELMVLGPNNYGKSEVRLVRLDRGEGGAHDLIDLNVSVALAGDLADTHLTGDNANVLPTDTQKNTVYAFARDGVGSVEAFGLRLARHFVDSQPTIDVARVSIEEYGWRRLGPHSFARTGEGVRTANVTYDGSTAWVVSGVSDLVLLNSTDSEFQGFLTDQYTALAPTRDRILATAVNASWRHAGSDDDWDELYVAGRDALVGAFVATYSLSLQQTLHAMGQAVLDRVPGVVEVRLSLPNRHHFLVDLEPFGLANPGEVYFPADRPYGLIEGSVLRDDAPPPGLAWSISA